MDNFNLRGAMTYTKAEITSGDNAGNEPRRQPKLMYNLMPTYNFSGNKNTAGLSFIGQTKAYAQDSNQLVMNGFVIVNAFVEVGITKGLAVNLSANNLLDTIAITESEEGSITDNTVNYVRARPMPGRSISTALTYRF
jgi:outer membrane receptor protein involved in Fe transport